MRKIILLKTLDSFQLLVKFDNGIQKKINVASYFDKPVFSVLKNNEELFQKVENHQYYIGWPSVDLDLSADTLWHDGI